MGERATPKGRRNHEVVSAHSKLGMGAQCLGPQNLLRDLRKENLQQEMEKQTGGSKTPRGRGGHGQPGLGTALLMKNPQTVLVPRAPGADQSPYKEGVGPVPRGPLPVKTQRHSCPAGGGRWGPLPGLCTRGTGALQTPTRTMKGIIFNLTQGEQCKPKTPGPKCSPGSTGTDTGQVHGGEVGRVFVS